MPVPHEIKALCNAVSWPPDSSHPEGASDEQIESAEARNGTRFPSKFRDFLGYLNGPRIGPGGILGVSREGPELDVCQLLDSYPAWKSLGWIPVAGDGCGNYYVLATRGSAEPPVGFVDTTASPNEIAYVVASDFWHFLDFLLRKDLRLTGWPFAIDDVIDSDPSIIGCKIAPLPWES